jgi:hypothetical protein
MNSNAQKLALSLSKYMAVWRINYLLKKCKISPLNKKVLDVYDSLISKLYSEDRDKIIQLENLVDGLLKDIRDEYYQYILAWEGHKLTTNLRINILIYIGEKHPGNYLNQWQELQIQENSLMELKAWKPTEIPYGEKYFPKTIQHTITQLAKETHPKDFASQLDFMNKQSEAYVRIRNWYNRDISHMIDKLKEAAMDQHPNDFVQQLAWIKIEESTFYQ